MSRDVPAARVALVAFGVVVLGALVWTGATSSAAHHPDNPTADGTSDLRQHVESSSGVGYATADGYGDLEPNGTVAVAAAADGTDAGSAAAFVDAGGALVVAADDPAANDLLSAVGAETRVDGRVLRDDRRHYRGPAMPVASTVGDHPLTATVDELALDRPTALEPNGATVLASTSDASYLVDGPRERLGEDESPTSHPVATVEDVGEGRVIVVGDAAVATNDLLGLGDNARFLANAYADAERVVLVGVDESAPPLAPVQRALGDLVGP